jgi:D-alanyl-D-alanine carboxypeptidase/D-alanyl-D-alanine-endopeptidase (penicillin-binding protein 4)
VDAWLAAKGLAMPGLHLDNGSGLSRDTRVTAAGLGAMLLDAWSHPQMADFIASLPIAAHDGTLRRRYQGDMAGRLSLKTGRLDEVSAIAGVMQSRAGKRYVVVVMLNAKDAHRGIGEAVHESVLRWVFGQ